MNSLNPPLLLPRAGSRILTPDGCVASLPTDSGACRFLTLPNNTLLAWWEDGDVQIWSVEGLMTKKLVEASGQPVWHAALLGDQRFFTATDSDIRIYTMAGQFIRQMHIAGSLRDVHVADDRIIAVSSNAVSVFSLEGHQQASLASDQDLNYDRGRFYAGDRIVLFQTLNRQEPATLLERLELAGKKSSSEIYLIHVFTDDLKKFVETIPNPHKKRIRTVLQSGDTLFTLAEDGVRVWAPGLRLLKPALHTGGMFYGEVLPLDSGEYLSHDSGRLTLFAIRDGKLSVQRRWKWSFLQRASETCALVKGWDGSIALLELRPPFTLRVIQASIGPDAAGDATWLPNKRRIVTYDSDGSIAIWDASGKPVLKRKRFGKRWWAGARELPDNRILLWDEDCVFLILSSEGEVDGEQIDRFRSKEGVMAQVKQVDLLANGTIIVSINGSVTLLEPKGLSNAPRAQGHDFGIIDVITLQDGGFITSGVDDRLIYWTKEAIARFVFEGHKDCVNGALEIGQERIVSWGDDGVVALWDHDGRLLRPPVLVHDKPIVQAKIYDDDHIVASDGTTLFLLSTNSFDNPKASQRNHQNEITDIKILRSGSVLSWDLDGRMFEWNALTSECEEVRMEGLSLVQGWETCSGGLLVLGSPISPREVSNLPDPIKIAKYAQLPLSLVSWRPEETRSKVLVKERLRRWLSLGGDYFIAVLSNGEAKLLLLEGAEMRVVAKVSGAYDAYPLADGRVFLSLGSEREASYDEIRHQVAPPTGSVIVTGQSKPKLMGNIVLDPESGAKTQIKSIGEADAVVALNGGWATLYRRDNVVRTFHPDGSPRSHHRFVGEAQFFGPRHENNVELLSFHKGQLLVYDLIG